MLVRITTALALACLADAQVASLADQVPDAFAIVQTYQAGDAFWDYGVVDQANRRVFIGRENGITALDVATGDVRPQFVLGHQVHAILLLDGNRALATNGADNEATIFDRDNGLVLAHIPTGAKPDGAAIEPVTGTAVIMDSIGHDAVFIDTHTAKVLGHLPLDGEPGTPVPDGHGLVFSAISDHSEVVVIDVAKQNVVVKYPLPQCGDAAGLALNPKTKMLLVTCANQKAIGIDSRNGRILGTVLIAKYPDVIVFDPVREVFYVPCIPGVLYVIGQDDMGAPVVRATPPMPAGVHTEALDAENGRLYLPAGDIIFPKKHGDRPGVKPGTFKIVVVDVTRQR